MPKHGLIYTNDNEYYTPKSVVDYFGKFDYDPATTEQKANEFGINNFDTINSNGILADWTPYRKIWINPPFTMKYEFMLKAKQTYQLVGSYIYILFPIEFLTTKLFRQLDLKGILYVPSGRIKFESGLGKKGNAPAFGSVILMLDDIDKIRYIDIELLRQTT